MLRSASRIDEENCELRDKIAKVQNQNKVLIEERDLLLQENIHKKKCIAKLYMEIKALRGCKNNQELGSPLGNYERKV